MHADTGDIRPDQLGANVVGGDHVEAVLLEAEILDQRAADVADADQYDRKVAVHAENRGYLPPQARDVVAVALLPEFTKAAEILPYLRRCQRHLPAQLAGGDTVHPRGLELVQLAQIAREPPYYVVGYLELFHFSHQVPFYVAPVPGNFISAYDYSTARLVFQVKIIRKSCGKISKNPLNLPIWTN